MGGFGGVREILTKETNGFVFIFGRRGTEEGELRERVDVHEVVGGGVVHVRQRER